jgi:hypothetical protein
MSPTEILDVLPYTREQLEALPWEAVTSSNVRRVAWEEHGDQQGDLFIDYGTEVSPSVYRYAGVTESRYLNVRHAQSVGGMVAKAVKGLFAATRIEIHADDPAEDFLAGLAASQARIEAELELLREQMANLVRGMSAVLGSIQSNTPTPPQEGT